MRLTNGDNPLDVVSVAVRHQLLRVWVLAKQLLQAQVGKNLGADEDVGKKLSPILTYLSLLAEIILKCVVTCFYTQCIIKLLLNKLIGKIFIFIRKE